MSPPQPPTADPTAAEPLVRVVDDDAAMRRAIAFLAESVGWQVATYADAEALLADLRPAQPGCLVLDVRMPGLSGLALQQELERRAVELPIVFITGHGDVSMAVEAMKHGAFDFIEKPFNDQRLLDAIGNAVRVSRQRRDSALKLEELAGRFAQLTPREAEVALQVARGLQNKSIARVLAISDRTVQVHRAHVMEKMQAHSAAELARILISLGKDVGAGQA